MIGFVLAPIFWGYNLVHWLRQRKRRIKQRSTLARSPSPLHFVPAASIIFSAITVIAALLAGATLAVVLMPMFIIAAIAIVLTVAAKALSGRNKGE